VRPHKIPNENTTPFYTNLDPVDAEVNGAGPGEPNIRPIVIIKAINYSSK
jgi:hypothetical protein